METLTKAWAAEFGPDRRTRQRELSRCDSYSQSRRIGPWSEPDMRGTPAGRSGTPDATAHAAVSLARDEATFVQGTVIDVDGGRTGVAVIAS